MNNFFKLVFKYQALLKILLILYIIYCSITIGISWDENFYKILGKINLQYLLSFGILDEDYYAKFRYSTIYWSFSYFITQLFPAKFEVEIYHIINSTFGLLSCVGLYKITKIFFNRNVARIAILFLLFIPFFFGHFAINNKDTILAFSHVWIVYYLAKYSFKDNSNAKKFFIIFKISFLTALASGVQLLFIGSLIPIFVIFIFTLFFLKKFKLKIFIVDFLLFLLLSYLILILFWVDTHENIFVLPYEFFIKTFTLEIGWPYNLVNGKYTLANEVGVTYLLANYFFKLPEYIVFLYLLSVPIFLLKLKELKFIFNNFKLKLISIIFLITFPNLILIILPHPIYDGLRLFLWVTPYLVIIPAILTFYIFNKKSLFFKLNKWILVSLFVFHFINFISFTPYQYTYLNIFNGKNSERYKKFENDYWSVTLKELILNSNLNENDEIKFTSCGINSNIAKNYMKKKYKNSTLTNFEKATYIIVTNRTLVSKENDKITNCFDEYNYENISQVKRNGLVLSSIKKIKHEN